MRRLSISSSLLATIVALLLTSVPGFATNWSGNISTHVTWAADSEITIVNSLTVTSTGWLTVEEGVAIVGSGSAWLLVESGGQLEINGNSGSPVTINDMVSITLNDCEGTTPITNTNFTDCGDPSGTDPFISLVGGEDDGYVINLAISIKSLLPLFTSAKAQSAKLALAVGSLGQVHPSSLNQLPASLSTSRLSATPSMVQLAAGFPGLASL